MTTLVDTNVLLDVVTMSPAWMTPSLMALERALSEGVLIVDDIVYAELSVGLESTADTDAVLRSVDVILAPIPREALFLAGKAFKSYRESGGTRTGVLPDFFIGAHALVENIPLLTRDPKRYRTYFPTVELIVPTA
ncbi:type II toxin-antitoxin system VapC family toxin [Bosea sp. R86505]|uniref:type II toxin-antitoxin system VapC family toxin n=1 Tax=Bosea sp. R86505 TaxID=3101710 RepID=UPI00366AEA42